MVSVVTTAEVNLMDIDTDDLIKEIESQGYHVTFGNQETIQEELDAVNDRIHTIFDDFLAWKDFGMSDDVFEKSLKQFFKDTIDVYEA